MSKDSLKIEASAVKRFADHLGVVDTDIELIRFAARRGEPGGYYFGIRNELEVRLDLDFTVDGQRCRGHIEPGCVRAWFCENSDAELETIHF